MGTRIGSVSLSLLLATLLVLTGNGLLSTLAAIRLAEAESSELLSGWVLAGYFAGLIVGTLVLPPTLRRVGNIRGFTALTALGVASALAHGFVSPGGGWALLRLLSGLSMAGVYMTVESWLHADADPSQRGRVLAAYLVAIYLGAGLGQSLVPLWPGSALEGFAFAALVVSAAVIPVSLTRTPQPNLELGARLPVGALLRAAPLGATGALVSGFLSGTVFASLPLAARTQGLAASDVAALMAAVLLGGLLGQWPIGWLSDRMDRRVTILLATTALATLCGVFPGFTEISLGALCALGGVFGALAFSLYPLAVAHVLDRVGPAQAMGASAQTLLASSAGAVVGPGLASAASHRFGAGALFAVDGLLLLGFALVVGVRMLRFAAPRQRAFRALPRTTAFVSELDPRTGVGVEPGGGPAGPGPSAAAPQDGDLAQESGGLAVGGQSIRK